MIISPNKRFVFVHIHKCAGTSIEIALAEHLGPNDLVIGSTPGGEKHKQFLSDLIGLKKHSSAADALARIGATRWQNYFTFAFVRHPVDRLRSLYHYSRGLAERMPLTAEEHAALQQTGKLPARPPYKFKAVQSALRSPGFDAFLVDPQTWQDPGAKPQWQSLCNAEGERLVGFVGKVEQLDADWAKVEQQLGLSAPVGTENRSPKSDRPSADDALSPQAWAQIRKHCLRDFKMFGYPVPAELHEVAPKRKAAGPANAPL
jgi:hypothetical protein